MREEFDIYKFYYLNHGELYQVKVANTVTIAYNYDNEFKLLSETYANDEVIRYTYNENGDVTAQYHNSNANPYVTYTYNADGELTQKINTDTGFKYIYGENGSVSVYRTSDNVLVNSYTATETEADEANNITAKTDIAETHFGNTYSSVVKDKSIDYTFNGNTAGYSYQTEGTDDSEKMTADTVKYNGNTVLSSAYTYDDKDNITNKLYSFKIDGEDRTVDIQNQYDSEGRITATGYNGYDIHYTYDSNGQLIRVDNAPSSHTATVYSYDSRGNVTEKRVHPFTYTEDITSEPTETKTFTYANVGWKDLLIAVDGVELTYDEIGNVLTFGSRSFTWNSGRNLAQITDGTNIYSYTYDENGIRTSKTVNGVTTYYNTKDGVIISQSNGTDTMYFQYDSNGAPLGFIYNGTQYFYMTNQMGDVIAIIDANYTPVCEYVYNEWGQIIEIIYDGEENSQQIAVANANPLRYRGYYYDAETEYYYLQSRYYDPSICRFINADIPEIAQLSKNVAAGTNLFAYCNNDAVNNSDPTGTFGTPIQWACAIIGAIVGVPFGHWLANKLGYYSGWRYWAIRSATVVGGAALGWFAGTKILKLVKIYVTNNPQIFIKISAKYGVNALNTFRWIFGLGHVYISKILLGSGLASKFVARLIVLADRIGSATKSDLYHRAASWLSESQLSQGKVYIINNGKRILLQVYGYLNGKRGVFEYIIDETGRVCHQVFKEGRYINGIPN